jgi:hypothetical protein
MANLIIGNDFIHFFHGNKCYTAHITRLVTEDQTIFNVFYNCLDSNEEGKCEVSFLTQGETNKLTWHTHTKNLSEEFILAIGREIEKKKELLVEA